MYTVISLLFQSVPISVTASGPLVWELKQQINPVSSTHHHVYTIYPGNIKFDETIANRPFKNIDGILIWQRIYKSCMHDYCM